MKRDVLLLVNRAAGPGRDDAECARLAGVLSAGLDGADVEVAIVGDHPAARARAAAFLAGRSRPALLVAGGGGGTLRAAVEGLADAWPDCLPRADEVVMAALRLGSGNVLARKLGMPADPARGVRLLAASLRRQRQVPVSVVRCRTGRGARERRLHGVTLGGFGQLAYVPGDLARLHGAWPRVRRGLAALVGIERVNGAEYAGAFAARAGAAILRPACCECVEVRQHGPASTFRLLAGALLGFPVPGIPCRPRVGLGDGAAVLRLLPRGGPTRTLLVTPGAPVTLRLVDRATSTFFLDEDTEVLDEEITIELAGRLTFVPGGEVARS